MRKDLLTFACRKKRADVVEYLLSLPTIDPAEHDNGPVRTAIGRGRLDILRMLVPYPNVRPFSDLYVVKNAYRWRNRNVLTTFEYWGGSSNDLVRRLY